MPPDSPLRSAAKTLAVLRGARRVWAVGAVHGQASRLAELHAALAERWTYFDRLVYLGNLIGHGPDCLGVLDEVLAFRRRALAVPHAIPDDIVLLRGRQEEMWQKLLQLQFAADPPGVLQWLISHGVGATLEAYGGSIAQAEAESRQGAVALTRWTQTLRAVMQRHPGHAALFANLRRAAYSDDNGLLLVSCGLDPTRRLDQQNDCFWWGHPAFGLEVKHFRPFGTVIRGLAEPRQGPAPGLLQDEQLVTLDGGSDQGGPLIAACFDTEGRLHDHVTVP
ncbi:MAG: hypothetical protein AAFY02_19610 [Pseudomonadota bacterium]